MVLFKVSEVER